ILRLSGLPKSLWGEAVMHTIWLKNRMSTRALNNKTPYEMLYQKKPNLKGLPVWGSCIWVHDMSRSKLNPRA
ncbi:hypothetical protein PAXINDRAFT_63241, partial [Paxillus involutus ATCC 200175]